MLFSGGAGFFVQYHDVVKSVYLTAIFKLIINPTLVDLPTHSLRHLSTISLLEWYLQRRYFNPLQSLDFQRKYRENELSDLLLYILQKDSSLYRLSPPLLIQRLLAPYTKQYMTFPLYIYTREEEPYVKTDCELTFPGLPIHYLYGDLKSALLQCQQNFTYMIADIELYKELVYHLDGTCSHLLLASDYRYNYLPKSKSFKYNLNRLMSDHPFVRLETNTVTDPQELVLALQRLANSFKMVQ